MNNSRHTCRLEKVISNNYNRFMQQIEEEEEEQGVPKGRKGRVQKGYESG